LTTTLVNLDFANEIALLSSKRNHGQDKLNRLKFGSKVGLKINTEKTNVFRLSAARTDPLK